MGSEPPTDIEEDEVLEIGAVDERLNEAAGHLNAQHGVLVEVAIWLLANVSAWQGDGLWKPHQYLAWRCGISTETATKIVDIAKRADEFPECVATLRRGEISLDQIAPMLRHAPGWADQQAAGLIPRCTVRQVSKMAKQYPWDTPSYTAPTETDADESGEADSDPADGDANDESGQASNESAPTTLDNAHRSSKDDVCWFGYDDNGRFRLHLETDQEVGATIETALTEARDSLFNNGHADVSAIDAVLEVCQRSLDTIESPDRRNRYRTNIHLNTDSQATDARGRHLPAPIAEHITCDGTLTPVFHENGVPISVGRTQHIVPDRTRRTVTQRDSGCRVPGCTHDRFIEVHHIIHWSKDGPTDTWNLICLCPQHHRLHHRGTLGITGNADIDGDVTFTDQHGRELTESGSRPKPPGAPPPPIDGTYQHPLGERLDFRWLYFNNDPDHPKPTWQNAQPIAS